MAEDWNNIKNINKGKKIKQVIIENLIVKKTYMIFKC